MSQACQTLMTFQYDLYLTGPDQQRASTNCGCHVHRHDYKALNEKQTFEVVKTGLKSPRKAMVKALETVLYSHIKKKTDTPEKKGTQKYNFSQVMST